MGETVYPYCEQGSPNCAQKKILPKSKNKGLEKKKEKLM
jgi:hypothetical protein